MVHGPEIVEWVVAPGRGVYKRSLTPLHYTLFSPDCLFVFLISVIGLGLVSGGLHFPYSCVVLFLISGIGLEPFLCELQ